jgi:succinate dehydrogenase / fumarate reductase iron-sulfur subunit
MMRNKTNKADERLIEFKIQRFKPGVIDPPRFQSFQVTVNDRMSVLDGLEQIRLHQDTTLMYRHSCHHSACGTCALRINGSERLACTTRILTLETKTVVLEPLRGLACLGDLVVEMTDFYRDIEPTWSLLKPAEPIRGAAGNSHDPPLRLEECIECGACLSACPAAHRGKAFMGPAALAALHHEIVKTSPDRKNALIVKAAAPNGEGLCERALSCSRVCPTQVYPARHIADLRRLVKTLDQNELK